MSKVQEIADYLYRYGGYSFSYRAALAEAERRVKKMGIVDDKPWSGVMIE